MKSISYMVSASGGERGLVYPSELRDAESAGPGSFLLMGEVDSRPEPEYLFPAVLGDKLISVAVRQDERSTSFYWADVTDVGRFLFHAESVRQKLPYLGSDASASGMIALRRLRAWRHGELDRACREHDFYFVGYAPRVGASA